MQLTTLFECEDIADEVIEYLTFPAFFRLAITCRAMTQIAVRYIQRKYPAPAAYHYSAECISPGPMIFDGATSIDHARMVATFSCYCGCVGWDIHNRCKSCWLNCWLCNRGVPKQLSTVMEFTIELHGNADYRSKRICRFGCVLSCSKCGIRVDYAAAVCEANNTLLHYGKAYCSACARIGLDIIVRKPAKIDDTREHKKIREDSAPYYVDFPRGMHAIPKDLIRKYDPLHPLLRE